MNSQPDHSRTLRHKCSACYKQYNKKEHLIEHMRVSYHSFHEPKCNVCKKHCKTYESVREHLKGPLPKASCADVFSSLGCDLCLNIFENTDDLRVHQSICQLDPASTPELMTMSSGVECSNAEMEVSCSAVANNNGQSLEAVALDCEMVGGGSDGSLNLCGRVCLIDENENVIFHSYVKPLIPVTDYRYKLAGITEEHLIDAMPLMQVKAKVEELLYNGESLWRARSQGGKAKILVGHNLDHDLECLKMYYPVGLLRDTAKYQPLLRTNMVEHSLKDLTKTYLGYGMQAGVHDPYEDCVAALRLYKRMRSQNHQTCGFPMSSSNDCVDSNENNPFDSSRPKDLEKLSSDALLEMSVPNYQCWCLDARQTVNS